MDKRYQVFVSSTYEDLKEERNEVLRALLELDCIPTAMEFFPAADDDSWTYIQRVIDECDYYVVIVGGRYGSVVDGDGVSFTEREYRYAVSIGKPHIVFLHGTPETIPVCKTDQDPEKKKRLDDFVIALKDDRNYKEWTNVDNLGAVLSRSMTRLIKSRPAVGWIRADQISESQKDELLRLRSRIEELENQVANSRSTPEDFHPLAFGSDLYPMKCKFRFRLKNSPYPGIFKEEIRDMNISWDDIFRAIGPSMISPMTSIHLRNKLTNRFMELDEALAERQEDDWEISSAGIIPRCMEEIKIQLFSLGLMTETVSEEPKHRCLWALTQHGTNYLTNVMGQRSGTPNLPQARSGCSETASAGL